MTTTRATDLQARILAELRDPLSCDDLATKLGVPAEALAVAIGFLVRSGKIIESEEGFRKPPGDCFIGTLRTKGRGEWQVMPDDRAKPFISVAHGGQGQALEGDRVLYAVLTPQKRKGTSWSGTGRAAAVIKGIIEHRPEVVTGIFEFDQSGRAIIRLFGRDKPGKAFLDTSRSEGLKPGQLVRVRLPRVESGRRQTAEFLEIVSSLDAPHEDVASIIALYDLHTEFSPEAEAQAAAVGEDPDERDFEGRLDLRHLEIVAIDPADAKDHDDAISIEPLDHGIVRIGIHIADVSHYVTPNSPIDQEAFTRGTSAYLPGRTLPMLPHKLSATLCSLKEGRQRLAKSCFITVNPQGRVVRREMYRSVVKVKRFLNYRETLGVLEDRHSIDPDTDRFLALARSAADLLQSRRMRLGSIALEIDRPHVRLDEAGAVVEVEADSSTEATNLIEEYMLAANCAVAQFLLEKELPYIGRQHPEPDQEAAEAFAGFCAELGVPAPDFTDPARIQLFLDGLAGREGAHALHLAVLKCMKRATYSAEPALHYALGFDAYTHFTSPIRRLCDLTVHQVLQQAFEAGCEFKWEQSPHALPWVDGKPISRTAARGSFDEWNLVMPAICARANETEVTASRAEMDVTNLKLLRMMVERTGESFMGTVVHISNSAVIVQLDEVMAEGNLSFADLSPEWITHKRFWLHYESRQGQRRIAIGDRLQVRVLSVDLVMRSMRLEIVEAGASTKPRFKDYRSNNGQRGNTSGSKARKNFAPRGKGKSGAKKAKGGKRGRGR